MAHGLDLTGLYVELALKFIYCTEGADSGLITLNCREVVHLCLL